MSASIHPSPPWYRSWAAIIVAAILLPPIGLMLLWMRTDTETGKKVFGSLGIVALSAAYFFLLFGGGLLLGKPDPRSEAHYSELERQRAQQREAAGSASTVSSTTDQKA